MLPQYAAVVRRPGNVQMQPRTIFHKAAEEQSCRDRAAAVLGGIADISIVAVDQSLIFREGRHPPEAFAGAIRRARQCRIEVLVVGHHTRGDVAEHITDRTRERRDVDKVRAALAFLRPRKRVCKDEAAFRVRVEDFHRFPETL